MTHDTREVRSNGFVAVIAEATSEEPSSSIYLRRRQLASSPAGAAALDEVVLDVCDWIDQSGASFTISGAGPAAHVAERVALQRPEAARSLLLIEPSPFSGTGLARSTLEAFVSARALDAHLEPVTLSVVLRRILGRRSTAAGIEIDDALAASLLVSWNARAAEPANLTDYVGPTSVMWLTRRSPVPVEMPAAKIASRYPFFESVYPLPGAHADAFGARGARESRLR